MLNVEETTVVADVLLPLSLLLDMCACAYEKSATMSSPPDGVLHASKIYVEFQQNRKKRHIFQIICFFSIIYYYYKYATYDWLFFLFDFNYRWFVHI